MGLHNPVSAVSSILVVILAQHIAILVVIAKGNNPVMTISHHILSQTAGTSNVSFNYFALVEYCTVREQARQSVLNNLQ